MNVFDIREATMLSCSERNVMGLLVVIQEIAEFTLWLRENKMNIWERQNHDVEKGKATAFSIQDE